MFPFTTYDRGEDLFKFSFAGGLFGLSSSEGRRKLHLFYIPISL